MSKKVELEPPDESDLTEEEEKAFGEWMECWSPNDCRNLLPDYMSPSLKRAVIKEMQDMKDEMEADDGQHSPT